MSKAPERIYALLSYAPIGGVLHGTLSTEKSEAVAQVEYVRADLLPVVKPLEWDRADLGVWGEYAETGIGRYALTWDFGDGPNGEQTKFKIRLNGNVIHNAWHFEAPYHIAQADHDARIRSRIDMTDPAELVAGAYEAAADELAKMGNAEAEIDNPHDAELIGFMARHVKTLTPADAQRALDAAIAKAVNAKLERAAKAVNDFLVTKTDLPFETAVNCVAAILAMKEPE